jgi:hypothetical protein
MKTIKSVWDRFESTVLKQMSDMQKVEMQKAFYLGIYTLLEMQSMLANSGLSEDVAVIQVQAWHEECNDFLQSIMVKPTAH